MWHFLASNLLNFQFHARENWKTTEMLITFWHCERNLKINLGWNKNRKWVKDSYHHHKHMINGKLIYECNLSLRKKQLLVFNQCVESSLRQYQSTFLRLLLSILFISLVENFHKHFPWKILFFGINNSMQIYVDNINSFSVFADDFMCA